MELNNAQPLIKVFDNILPVYIQNTIENQLLRKEFTFNPNIANRDPNDYFPAFSRDLTTTKQDFILSNQIIHYLGSKLNLYITDIIRSRLIFQLPANYSLEDYSHRDLDYPHFTCIYYVNDSDGDTIFYTDYNGDEIKRVSPKKGRIAFFDGSIIHTGTYPTIKERVIINSNFLAEKF